MAAMKGRWGHSARTEVAEVQAAKVVEAAVEVVPKTVEEEVPMFERNTAVEPGQLRVVPEPARS